MASESLVLALLLGVIGTCWGEDEPPVFVNNMRGLQISESTEVGTSVYTLSATGEEPIIYDIKADMFTVNATTGVVTLSRPVDYESGEIKFSVQVIAIANNGLVETVSPTVEVLDANDNPPQFLRETYRQIIPEDYAIGNEVISNLRAEDKDFKGGVIVVTCEPDAILASPNNTHETHSAYVEACETFEPVMLQSSNKRWLGSIRLLKTLDYETRSTYQLPLVIRDGTLAHMQSFEITISDVNDAPPRFTYVPENVPIKENLDIGTVIERVQAEDGDTNKRRPIRYNVTRCPEDTSARKDADNIFTVNFLNGTISTKTNIDRENAFVIAGLKLCIKAQELNNKTIPISLGNDSETTAVALIHIDVQDLNDQIPSFSNDNYNTSIYEDIPDGTAVPGIALTITDLDSYPANSYDVRLVNYQDVFEVFPVNGTGRNIGGIKVKDTSKIDYESGNRLFELRIIAYENRFAEGGFQPNTGSTKVSIHVLDVNDNTPKFSQNVYNVSVMEKDIGTQPFITYIQAIDPDSGPMGTTGITYRLLGSESERFQIEPTRRGRSAEVRVSPCRTPGQGGDCINYERRRRYDFTIIARDELGSPKGRQGTAELVIHVIDENDVWPVFTLNSYVGDIKEGELLLVNELRVKAEDTDTVGKISYTLSPGSQYWRIHPDTGLISAKETIFRRFTPGDRGWFNLIVLANDTVNTVSTDVIINVIDQNNFAPKFSPNVYITKIPEETKGDVSVITVEATDQDSSLSENGQVEYNIEEGSQGRFVMNNGTIYTATNAAFDYDVQKEYILRVLARDGGNPQKTGTSSVTISIIDQNNKLPYFLSLVQFAEISENAQKGEYVTTILAKDPDEDAKLSFELVEEIKAISPDGVNVDPNDYAFKNLFQLDSTSGVVRVNAQRLDRDRTSVITYNMTVTDVSQTPTTGPQIGTPGILIIRIKEYNDQSPAFQRSRYDLSVEEEQPIGTFVVALVAQDADDAIKQYDIVERDQNLFSIISETGVLIVRSRIDYERIERTQFTVRAIDNGQPQRTGTAQVFINIINTNDNSPIPSQNTYQVNIPENSTGGTSLLQVFASDMDKGDYGEIRFELPKDVTRFTINPYSGVMVLAPGVQLDREVEPIIPTRVNVYDSPSDETVRRRYSVPVYVTLLDVNDNWPIFSNEDLSAEIIESIDIGAPILQVFATDRDYGINAQIVFRKVAGSGDTGGLFSVSPQSGQILVERSLRGRIGIYAFNVSATDRNGGPDGLKGYSRIVITVVESLNSPPVWTIPPNDNMTIEVLESQYLGMLVFDANADDNNSGRNGIVEYYFQDGNTTVSNTGEFSINRVTGVIRAEIIYDRETVERYTLHLIAKDMGVLSLRSERHLYVKIIDVNDNIPEFEMSNGKTIPMDILLWENTTVGAAIGSVKATDDDSEFYTTIYYYIVAGGEGKFAVDKDTGVIRLSQAVDREIRSTYSFDIRATNADNDYFLITNRNAIDTSIITVRVTLRDVNDNAPVFVGFNSLDAANNHYFGFISLNAPYDQRIVQVTATDVDAAGSAAITYSIIGGNDDGGFFTVDMIGRVANKRLLNEVTTRIYSLTIQAFDSLLTSTATTYVFVTNAGNEVKLVINLEPSEVKVFRSQIIRLLMSFPGISHASILSIKNHVVGQVVDTTRSDVIVVAATAVPAGGYVLLSTSQLLLLLQEKRRESGAVFHSFYVESIGPAGGAATWLDWTPVLAVVIIIILLILMAILLLLFCCCCIKDSGKKKPQTPGRCIVCFLEKYQGYYEQLL